jgi:hypothetical protein
VYIDFAQTTATDTNSLKVVMQGASLAHRERKLTWKPVVQEKILREQIAKSGLM